MESYRFSRIWPLVKNRNRQRGQALIYGMFVLIGSLTGLFFLFNTGQLASEKTKLVNAADAVAYSAAVMHARALNFDAYSNRALMANEVIVAQLVSLSSWAQYAQTHVQNVPLQFPECTDPRLAVVDGLINFDPAYAAMCFLLTIPADPAVVAVQQLGAIVPQVAQMTVSAVELNKTAIQGAESLLHAPLYFTQMRASLMQDVADRNYQNDGSVIVYPNAVAGVTGLTDDWDGFVTKYKDGDRVRLGEAAAKAAAANDFVNSRKWTSEAVLPINSGLCFGKNNAVERRGGTDLIGLDEWKSEDTESFWSWHRHGFLFGRCRKDESPIASAEQRAFPSGLEGDASNATLGGSPATNPYAHSLASSTEWTNYHGLPAFYDLSPARLASPDDPRLTFAVKLVRTAANMRTSSGASSIAASPRLNKFADGSAGGVMSAVSTGEVYFERPWFNNGNNSYTTALTEYLVTQNQTVAGSTPQMRELGSLFNPYWRVRLADNKAADIQAQQGLQGVVMR
ncbi:MAG: hypothetical protein H7244_12610 [Herminiimonas sp.]|nr:hypothetical protein [Herminiimonas sp.]